jgi:redox-sensitive bicupin YhaK (pirin superfamily)
MELVLRRTTIAPGGGLPPHSHPGSIVLVVDAGTFGFTPLGGTTQLTRAAVDGTPAPAEEVSIGTEVILTKGDALFLEDPQDTIRNAGEDDVVLLLATLTPVGEDFTTLHE